MVYAKIDWYTAIFENCSLRQICDKIHIDCTYYDELLQSNYERSLGYDSNFVMNIHGISFEIRFNEALEEYQKQFVDGFGDANIVRFFDKIFSTIRLDISGTGLEFLRCKFEVDSMMTEKGYFLPYQMHVTRADFAFDFVNEQFDEYFKPLYNFLVNKSLRTFGKNSVKVDTSNKPLSYNLKAGEEETIYIGSSRSDRMLRIYNKKLQLCPKGIWKEDKIPLSFTEHESSDINTWFRIEFQTRNNKAMSLLYSCKSDLKNILLLMEYDYMFIGDDGKPLLFCETLYNWSELQEVIQNAKYYLPKATTKRIKEQFDRNFVFNFLYIAMYGIDNFIDELNKSYENMFNSSNGLYRQRRLMKIAADIMSESDTFNDISNWHGINGNLICAKNPLKRSSNG